MTAQAMLFRTGAAALCILALTGCLLAADLAAGGLAAVGGVLGALSDAIRDLVAGPALASVGLMLAASILALGLAGVFLGLQRLADTRFTRAAGTGFLVLLAGAPVVVLTVAMAGHARWAIGLPQAADLPAGSLPAILALGAWIAPWMASRLARSGDPSRRSRPDRPDPGRFPSTGLPALLVIEVTSGYPGLGEKIVYAVAGHGGAEADAAVLIVAAGALALGIVLGRVPALGGEAR
ncbi:MAG: hypothetical protein AAF501_01270 [Pseudomonadota bacterium]